MTRKEKGLHLFRKAQEALDTMRAREALQLFKDAERAGYDPDESAAGSWTCHMLCGEFEEAWLESDAIEKRGKPDPLRFWDGKPLTGKKVILRCLHGLGDTLQFIRFAPFIRARAAEFTIESQPQLKTLMAAANVADHVITWGEASPDWDSQIEVNELPRLFRVTEDSIPNAVPYLRVPQPRRVHLGRKSGVLRVGLVWRSSDYNPLRSLSLEQIAPLLEIPGYSFFSLQAGPVQAELAALGCSIPNLGEQAADVLETAENMLSMDLIISVDTMTAHLAGALGLPVWILLPLACDWRWMVNRTDSPWYPTARLFRQQNPGDWTSVIRQVRDALRSFPQEDATASRSRYLASESYS